MIRVISINCPCPSHVSITRTRKDPQIVSERSRTRHPKIQSKRLDYPERKFKLGPWLETAITITITIFQLCSLPNKTMANHTNDLFSSLISDIKTYSGKDPLLPWLRYIHFSVSLCVRACVFVLLICVSLSFFCWFGICVCGYRGIRKLKESLPSQLLKEKLPRFLQKCAKTFESDRRYRNDLRYLRVWLQLVIDKPLSLFIIYD
jgi:hypothetical protein